MQTTFDLATNNYLDNKCYKQVKCNCKNLNKLHTCLIMWLTSSKTMKKWPDSGNNDSSQQPYVNLLENWEASNRWILWLIKIFYFYCWQTEARLLSTSFRQAMVWGKKKRKIECFIYLVDFMDIKRTLLKQNIMILKLIENWKEIYYVIYDNIFHFVFPCTC